MWHEAKKGDVVQSLYSGCEECWALLNFTDISFQILHAVGKPVHGFPSTTHLLDLGHLQMGMQKLSSLEPTTLITLLITANCLNL